MNPEIPKSTMNRRQFMATAGAAAVLAGAGSRSIGLAADDLDRRNEQPDKMPYRKLGRTNFNSSRLVFGCGAALAGGKAVRLLERAYESGINFYDVGYDAYYKGSEKYLAPFMKRHKGDVWITSKAPARVSGNGPLTVEQAKGAAEYWSNEMNDSLTRMETDYVDAYYLMGVSNPELMKSEEIGNAFRKAKEAGKVGHLGISTHQNAQECLAAAIEVGWYDLAMIAITPAGWYDYVSNKLLDGKGSMKDIGATLDKARAAGIGLIGMKAARFIAVSPYGGVYGKVNDESIMTAFDKYYEEKLLKAPLTAYQRSYAYVLEHGLDVVNADMQNFKHFEENLLAARTSAEYFA